MSGVGGMMLVPCGVDEVDSWVDARSWKPWRPVNSSSLSIRPQVESALRVHVLLGVSGHRKTFTGVYHGYPFELEELVGQSQLLPIRISLFSHVR
jgi:hypothetical protein